MNTSKLNALAKQCVKMTHCISDIMNFGLKGPGVGNTNQFIMEAADIMVSLEDAITSTEDKSMLAASMQMARDANAAAKCKDHIWVDASNDRVKGMEMCLTCFHNGEENVPIRATVAP